jgi:hypothetical protein
MPVHLAIAALQFYISVDIFLYLSSVYAKRSENNSINLSKAQTLFK